MYTGLNLDQSTIIQQLNDNIKDMDTLIDDHSENCVKQVFGVLCRYYLPPCGNYTHPVPPSSICQEQCQMVQRKCKRTWDTVLFVFKDISLPTIQCNDTSKLLFSLPHCCSDGGLGLSLYLFLKYKLAICICRKFPRQKLTT